MKKYMLGMAVWLALGVHQANAAMGLLAENVQILSIEQTWYFEDYIKLTVSSAGNGRPCDGGVVVVGMSVLADLAASTPDMVAADYMNRLFTLAVTAKQSGATVSISGTDTTSCNSGYAIKLN